VNVNSDEAPRNIAQASTLSAPSLLTGRSALSVDARQIILFEEVITWTTVYLQMTEQVVTAPSRSRLGAERTATAQPEAPETATIDEDG